MQVAPHILHRIYHRFLHRKMRIVTILTLFCSISNQKRERNENEQKNSSSQTVFSAFFAFSLKLHIILMTYFNEQALVHRNSVGFH